MKNFIKNFIRSSALVLCFAMINVIFGQELIINDGTARYEEADYPAVEVFMEPEPDDVKEAWKDFLKDRYDVRLRGYGFLVNKDVLSAEGVDFKEVAPERLDFYTRVIEENDLTKMQVFASKGYDINVGRSNDYGEYYKMKAVVQSFLDNYLQNYYKEKIEEAQERVNEIEENRNDKRETLDNNEAEIAELRQENETLRQEINTLQDNWSEAQENLDARQQKLDEIIKQLAASGNSNYYNTNYDNK